MRGRPKGAPSPAALTFEQIAAQMGVPKTTVYRDFDRFRDVLALEIVFAVLPRSVQRRWLRSKLAPVQATAQGTSGAVGLPN